MMEAKFKDQQEIIEGLNASLVKTNAIAEQLKTDNEGVIAALTAATQVIRELLAERAALKALVETAYEEGEGVIMSETWAASDSAKKLQNILTQANGE